MKQFTKAVGGMKSSVIYTDADRRHFRFSEGTWAWRNHNSGNVYPKQHGKFTNQIGKTHNFAIFSDDQSGHEALIKVLSTTYANSSIDQMIVKYAPPDCNPTEKYRRFLHKQTGVSDNTKIKNFTKSQFEKLWEAIQRMEGYKPGKITEVYQITGVQKTGKNLYQYCFIEGEWITEVECINFAKQGKVELEVCLSHLGNIFLRSPPSSSFQRRLGDLM